MRGETAMNGSDRATMISRRDATRLLLAATGTLVTGLVLAGSLRGAAAAQRAMARGAAAAHPEKGLANMTPDLAKLTAEHFEPLVGETFTIGEYQVTLRDVRRQKIRSRFREQFSITFKAPRDLPIRSERLSVTHPAIGRHDLLVTQILDGAEGTALEICFS
jgi:hypothetical protein